MSERGCKYWNATAQYSSLKEVVLVWSSFSGFLNKNFVSWIIDGADPTPYWEELWRSFALLTLVKNWLERFRSTSKHLYCCLCSVAGKSNAPLWLLQHFDFHECLKIESKFPANDVVKSINENLVHLKGLDRKSAWKKNYVVIQHTKINIGFADYSTWILTLIYQFIDTW